MGVATTYKVPRESLPTLLMAFLFLCIGACTPHTSTTPLPQPERTLIGERDTTSVEEGLILSQQAIDRKEFAQAYEILFPLYENRNEFNKLNGSTKLKIVESIALVLSQESVGDALQFVRQFNYLDTDLVLPVNLLLADLYLKTAAFVPAISILNELGAYGHLPQQEANERIWRLLFLDGAIHSINWSDVNEPDLLGWHDLASIYRSSTNTANLRDSFESWRASNTQHPAANHLLDPFVHEDLSGRGETSNQIGFILPKQGRLSLAASTIRDGFMLAYMSDVNGNQSDSNIEVRFYDSYGTNPVQLVERSFEDGADLVVGFIDKDNVSAILRQASFPGPIMLLNRIENQTLGSQQILQFSLSIDDEIETIAEELKNLGHERIVLFAGDHNWAIRSRNRFLDMFGQDFGVIVAQQYFLDPTTIIDAVGEGLDIAKSVQRHAELEQLTRDAYEFIPRRRMDIDAIVAFVDEGEFDSMLAALNYHYATDVPLYVTEAAVRSGKTTVFESPVYFTATPWLIEDTAMEQTVQSTFSPKVNMKSLYAFGIDIYRIASDWERFQESRWIVGSSGVFELDQQGVIVRQPVWGQLDNQVFQVHKKDTGFPYNHSYTNLPVAVR